MHFPAVTSILLKIYIFVTKLHKKTLFIDILQSRCDLYDIYYIYLSIVRQSLTLPVSASKDGSCIRYTIEVNIFIKLFTCETRQLTLEVDFTMEIFGVYLTSLSKTQNLSVVKQLKD